MIPIVVTPTVVIQSAVIPTSVTQNVMVLNGVRAATQSVVGDRSVEADRYVEVDRSVVTPCEVRVETPYAVRGETHAAFLCAVRVRSAESLCVVRGPVTRCEVPVGSRV